MLLGHTLALTRRQAHEFKDALTNANGLESTNNFYVEEWLGSIQIDYYDHHRKCRNLHLLSG